MAISAYTKTTWANSPATTSQLNAANLQHLEDQVKDITDACLTPTAWTPTIIGSTTAGTQTYTAQNGSYIKIGRLVFIEGYVAISAKDAGITGYVAIGGLPFAAASTYHIGFSLGQWRGLTLTSGYTQAGLETEPGESRILLTQSGSTKSPALIAVADLNATSGFIFGGCYISAS